MLAGVGVGETKASARRSALKEYFLISDQIAAWIDEGVHAARRQDEVAIARIGNEVLELALDFPIPGAAV
jgi:hypothetical protein